MRKSTAAAAAASLIIAMAMLTGCTTWFQAPSAPAAGAIATANEHLKKAASLEQTVTADAASLQNVPYTKAGAKSALKLTGAITKTLKSERAELVAAKAAMDGIAKLEVEEALKQYAQLESASIDARIALADAEARLYDAFDRLYGALAGSGPAVDNQEISTAIQLMQQEVTALGETAAAAAKTATDFYNANKLGG
jgi:hypothetical protein